MGSVAPRIVNHASYVTRINFEIILRFFHDRRKYLVALEGCAHPICVPAAGMPPAKRENAKTGKRENGG